MKKVALITILVLSINLSGQEKEFLNKVEDIGFKNILDSVITIRNFNISNIDIYFKDKFKLLTEQQSIKYLKFPKDSLYDIEEFYNQDEEITTYGSLKSIFPFIRYKFYINENIVCLIVFKEDGINEGDLSVDYLYLIDTIGNIINKMKLSSTCLFGIPPTFYGFIDNKNFNTYLYNSYNKENNKYENYCIERNYTIEDNGQIIKLSEKKIIIEEDVIENQELENRPKSDPMRIFLNVK